MESPSAAAHRGRVPWQGLLLAVSLLTFWSPPTTAQLTVASINATEGEDVLLLVHNVPEDIFGYIWYRGESSDGTRVIAIYVIHCQIFGPGPAYSGRETIHPNGSLLLQNVTLSDTGYYTMQALQETLEGDKATGQLHVYPEKDYTGYPVGTIVGIVIGVLVLLALGTALGCFMYYRRTRRASDKRDLTEHRPPASTPGQGPSGASASQDLLQPNTDVY